MIHIHVKGHMGGTTNYFRTNVLCPMRTTTMGMPQGGRILKTKYPAGIHAIMGHSSACTPCFHNLTFLIV